MNDKKKAIGAILILTALLFLASRLFRLPFVSVHPHQAIPNQTALFFSFNKSQIGLLKKSKAAPTFSQLLAPNILSADIDIFDEIFGREPDMPNDQSFYATINPTKKSGTDLLFIMPGARSINIKKCLKKNKNWRSRKFIFKGQEIYTLKNNDQQFSFSRYRNLLLFARHAYLVENAISQLKKPNSSICRDKGFKSIAKNINAGKNSCPVFINIENIDAQFSPLIEASKTNTIKNWASTGHWLQIDLPLGKNPSEWKGRFVPDPENTLLLANSRSEQKPFTKSFQSIPDNISGYISLSIKDLKPKEKESFWQRYFLPWMGDEIIFATGEKTNKNEPEKYLLLQTKDDAVSENSLDQLAVETGQSDNYDFQLFKIHQLKKDPVSEILGLKMEAGFRFATVLGEYVIFSNSGKGLERWLGKYMAGQTFSKNANFLKLQNELPGKSNGRLYMDGLKSWQYLSSLLNENFLNSLQRYPLPFKKMAASIKWDKHIAAINFIVPKNDLPAQGRPANILWNVPLSSPAKIKPAVFKNPQNGELDIFMATEDNRIYLISRSGRILWQRQLEEEILSDITHIDFYNNGEGQFVFSTRSAIYIIDRNGEYLEGFPLYLQVPASNGVTVVDFFQSHDYIFFISCENGKAYGFDKKGSPVEGWRPNEKAGIVEQPILHFQTGGKDFLALLDEAGTLRVFKKNGSPRFDEIDFGTPDFNKLQYQASRSFSRIVACDKTGKAHVVNLKGDHFKLNLKTGNNKNVKFIFADILGDKRKDYISLSENNLVVHFYKKNKFGLAFEKEMPSNMDGLFSVKWKKKLFIGTVNKQKGQIFVVNAKGNIPDQFPLAGSTPFVVVDLLGEGKPVVVTGDGAAVTAYTLE